MDRRTVSLVALSMAVAICGTAYAVSWFCGAQVVDADAPGEPRNPSRCASAPHHLSLVVALLGLALMGASWRGWPWPLIGIGGLIVTVGLTVPFLFTYIEIGAGLLMIVAGSVLVVPREKRPASQKEPLSNT